MRDRTFFRLLFCASLVDLSTNIPATILPLLMLAERHAAQLIAATMFVPLVVGLFATLPSGPVVDRIGSPKALFASAVGLMLSTGSLFWAHSLESIGLILGLRGLCAVLFMTASFVYAASSEDPKQRLYGVTWLAMAVTVSFSIGPALSMFFWQHGVREVQFLVCAVLCGIAVFQVPPAGERTAQARAAAPAGPVPYAAWTAPLCFCIAVSAIAGVNSTLAMVGLHARGLNGGLFFSATAVGMLLARIPSAAIVHRYGAIAAAAGLAAVMLLGGTMVAVTPSNLYLAAGAALMGAAWTSMLPACTTMLLASSSPETRGRAMGAYTFAMSIGAVIGGAGATRLAALPNGYAAALLIACTLPAISLAFLIPSERRRSVFQARAAVNASE